LRRVVVYFLKGKMRSLERKTSSENVSKTRLLTALGAFGATYIKRTFIY